MRIFNIGIIGYGGFGKFLHNAWNHLDNVRVIAVADKMAEAMIGLNGIKTFTDWRDLLLEKDIDVVAIVTEPATHETIATACMEAGKHVLIEKPLAIALSDAEKIRQTRDRTGTVAAIDFIMRFNPFLQTIQGFTRQEIFGKLRRVDVENYAQDEQLPPEHWFWHPERSGGISYEVNEIITGKFRMDQSKQEVYADCVRASLLDVLKKIENPAHQLSASLETGIASLEVAVRATESARGYKVKFVASHLEIRFKRLRPTHAPKNPANCALSTYL